MILGEHSESAFFPLKAQGKLLFLMWQRPSLFIRKA